MNTPREHSDYYGSDNAEQSVPARGPKWRPVFLLDRDGNACQVIGWLAPDAMTGAQWMQHMRDTRDRYPLPTADIVLPKGYGWVVDEDGTGIEAVDLKTWAARNQLEQAA